MTLQRGIPKKLTSVAADCATLDEHAAKINTLHARSSFRMKSLSDARTEGAELAAARKLLRQFRRADRSLPTWTDWVRTKTDVSGQHAARYQRIYHCWDQVKHLVEQDCSINAAIRFLNTGSTELVRKPKPITINFPAFLEAIGTKGYEFKPTPLELEACLNAALQASKRPHEIRIRGHEVGSRARRLDTGKERGNS
jgi:hypothetical protein